MQGFADVAINKGLEPVRQVARDDLRVVWTLIDKPQGAVQVSGFAKLADILGSAGGENRYHILLFSDLQGGFDKQDFLRWTGRLCRKARAPVPESVAVLAGRAAADSEKAIVIMPNAAAATLILEYTIDRATGTASYVSDGDTIHAYHFREKQVQYTIKLTPLPVLPWSQIAGWDDEDAVPTAPGLSMLKGEEWTEEWLTADDYLSHVPGAHAGVSAAEEAAAKKAGDEAEEAGRARDEQEARHKEAYAEQEKSRLMQEGLVELAQRTKEKATKAAAAKKAKEEEAQTLAAAAALGGSPEAIGNAADLVLADFLLPPLPQGPAITLAVAALRSSRIAEMLGEQGGPTITEIDHWGPAGVEAAYGLRKAGYSYKSIRCLSPDLLRTLKGQQLEQALMTATSATPALGGGGEADAEMSIASKRGVLRDLAGC